MRRLMMSIVLMLAVAPALAAMQARPVEWKVGKATFSGVLVYDDATAGKRPGLVMVPNWMGVTPSAVEKARQVAGNDYVVLVADLYGKGRRPKDAKEAGALAKGLREDRALLRARMDKSVAVLKAQAGKAPLDSSRIAALGFCLGGTAALELARAGSDVAAVISLHGGLATPLPAQAGAVRTSILVLNGADDSGVTDDHIAAFGKEMDAAGADWQFVNFSGAVHCFAEADANSPPNCLYNERAAKRAFGMMHDFLRERFATR